ncbi:ribonuclease [Streptomyces sp. yr375]|uniref:ribonuclease domain-containing protein n=1 Tax=Streptomyces sp. yr375 TaxID=1761906 RepID=UPI0008D18B89|nr:ribonuclease domain-containing protein [Streptomyces sp. yr375]SES46228.1 ribonuclease [Streptomyces sp. yr375]
MTLDRDSESSTGASAEPAEIRRHKRRSRWLSAKFLALFLAIATILGGVALLAPQAQDKASAATDKGDNFTFPSDLEEMVAFWNAKAWPTNKATSSEVDQNGVTAFMYRGGTFGDRDGQLTAFIQANFPTAVTPSFSEYDVDFRQTRRTPRNARRVVRDSNNGFIFYTDDHYANFHLFAYQNLPDVDDAAPSIPENTFTTDNSLTPVAEETAGDPPAGGSGGGSVDPTVFLPIENATFEEQNNAALGQADERGDSIFVQIGSFLLGALLLISVAAKG